MFLVDLAMLQVLEPQLAKPATGGSFESRADHPAPRTAIRGGWVGGRAHPLRNGCGGL